MSLPKDIQSFVQHGNESSEGQEALKRTIEAVKSGDATLLHVVQALGLVLTDEEPFTRAKGMEFIANIIADLDKSQVGSHYGSVLLRFFLDRLHDQTSVGEIVKGIRSLLELDVVSKQDACTIPSHIFNEVNVQSFQQGVRQNIFRIIDNVLHKNLDYFEKDDAFVTGWVTAMDGEKDPRNLMITFKIMKTVLENLRHNEQGLTEDLFEVCFSYFPITFKPPADDPHGITTEGLRQSLLQCLMATPHFAEFAIPSLLEKLATQSALTKREATHTMGVVAPIYGMESLIPHLDTIWELLKEDVEKAQDLSEEQTIGLECIKSLATTLAAGAGNSQGQSPLDQFVNPIVKDCLTYLEEPESKLARPAGRMLGALASSSDAACCAVVANTLPNLLKKMQGNLSVQQKRVLLDVVRDVITASTQVYTSDEITSPISTYTDELLELYTSAASSSDETTRISGIRGLSQLLHCRGVLQPQDKTLVVQCLNTGLLDGDQDVAKTALGNVMDSVGVEEGLVQTLTIPHLTNSLEQLTLPNDDLEYRLVQQDWILQSLEGLGSKSSVLALEGRRALVELLQKRLQHLSGEKELSSFDLEFCASLIASLTQLAQYCKDDQWNGLIIPIMKDALHAKEAGRRLHMDSRYLALLANLIGTVVQSLDTDSQRKALEQTMQVFNGQATSLDYTKSFAPLNPNSAEEETHLSTLFAAVVCHCSKQVLDKSVWIDAASASKDSLLAKSLSQASATIVNKALSESEATILIEDALKGIPFTTPSNLVLWSWLGRALTMSCHPLATKVVENIISTFDKPDLGLQAAQSFQTLIGESTECLGKNNATTKLLYKQKFFQTTLPLLTQGFKNSEAKQHYLIALSFLLANVPKSLLLNHAGQILPLLLESLQVTDPKLKNSTLELMGTLIVNVPKLMGEHISSLVPQLLQLCNVKTMSDSSVRISALKCLRLLPTHVRYDILHPHRQHVLKVLAESVDDPKKAVRKEAVITRAKWFNVDLE